MNDIIVDLTDDHRMVIDGLKGMLQGFPGIKSAIHTVMETIYWKVYLNNNLIFFC